MKSFKQKIEERKARLIAERLLQEERNRKILKQQESDRIERQRIAKELEAEQWSKEQALYESQLWDQQERKRLKELRLERIEEEMRIKESQANEVDWKDTVDFRSKQKEAIYEILNSEQRERNYIISERDRIENDLAHERYLAEQESKRLELEEKERLQLEEMERIEAEHIAEQEKYALWERLEKEENDRKEQERLEEERRQLEDEDLRKTSEMLERIEAERIEYEDRQKRIAEGQKESREEVNKILLEAQDILHSNQQSTFKNKLSGLHDYIYRLDVTESNPWTDRKQPISILTWEDWKQAPGNKLLIEEDFRRARLLFEQDNMRAKRYHDYIWHQMPARNLTLQRKQALDDDGKLVDQDRNQLLNTRQELMESIGGISFWLDAYDTSTIDNVVTESMGTASISAMWVPASHHTALTTFSVNDLTESSSLVVSGANALFDGNPDTYMSIYHTSGSDFDWNDRNLGVTQENRRGVVYLRVKAPPEFIDKKITTVELYSTDRKFIPEMIGEYWRGAASAPDTFTRFGNHNITSSMLGNYNNQSGRGGENVDPFGSYRAQIGGRYGITPEGSASLDPFEMGLFPQLYREGSDGQSTWTDNYYAQEFAINMRIAATGSELRFNQLIINYEGVSSSIEHGQGVSKWKCKPGPDIEQSTAVLHRSNIPWDISRREQPLGMPIWYSASMNQPDGINMPYIQFSSQSHSWLTPRGEFNENKTGFTQFVVLRDTMGDKNSTGIVMSDWGENYKTAWRYGINGHNKDIFSTMVDWDIDDGTNGNTKHLIQLGNTTTPGEIGPNGLEFNEWSSSAWPYASPLDHQHPEKQHMKRGMCQTETTVLTVQLDNPMTEVSSSRFRLWHKGATPFVDMDAALITDYSMTSSKFRDVNIGASAGSEWFDGRIHEMINFNKVLSKHEIDTVHDYLAHKWKLNVYSVKSDVDNDFVYGLSSSNSSMDTWTFDGTDVTATDGIYSSSAWELG